MHMAMMLMSPAWTCAQSNSKPLNVRIRFDIQFVFVLINLRIVDSSEIPDSSHPYSGVVYKKAIEWLIQTLYFCRLVNSAVLRTLETLKNNCFYSEK